MSPARRVLRSETARRLSCWLIHLYILLVYRTGRWTVEGAEIPRRLADTGKPFILAFWHGRLLMIPMMWRNLPQMHMLISGHRDGRIIAGAVRYFGIDSIAGSSNAGGGAALRAMLRHVKHGDCVGITPDGPDGPAMRASSGIVAAARLTRAPVVPITYATARRRILRSWDRFHLPFPWTRGIYLWGEPITVPHALDAEGVERWRRLIEERMIAQTAEADRRVGCEATSPGTLGREDLRALHRAAPGGGR
ncbi:MAG TPA: lysophospholipid acyltransferase family protein [Stellaceae bacterium]|nr:lysophospholipid acyltransferase family protein [Stellaceae bacterium]